MTQVQLLVAITQSLLGDVGLALLGFVVLLACVTTAIALVGSAAAFFNKLLNGRLSYRLLLGIDCIIGVVICNLGLDKIIEYANYVLGAVYPPFMTAIIMLLFYRHIKSQKIYLGAAIGAFSMGALLELYHAGIFMLLPLDLLPLYTLGFAWLPFAILGGVIGWLVYLYGEKRVSHDHRSMPRDQKIDFTAAHAHPHP